MSERADGAPPAQVIPPASAAAAGAAPPGPVAPQPATAVAAAGGEGQEQKIERLMALGFDRQPVRGCVAVVVCWMSLQYSPPRCVASLALSGDPSAVVDERKCGAGGGSFIRDLRVVENRYVFSPRIQKSSVDLDVLFEIAILFLTLNARCCFACFTVKQLKAKREKAADENGGGRVPRRPLRDPRTRGGVGREAGRARVQEEVAAAPPGSRWRWCVLSAVGLSLSCENGHLGTNTNTTRSMSSCAVCCILQ